MPEQMKCPDCGASVLKTKATKVNRAIFICGVCGWRKAAQK